MFEKVKNLTETYLLDCEVFYLPYVPQSEKKKIYERRKKILAELAEILEKEYRGD